MVKYEHIKNDVTVKFPTASAQKSSLRESGLRTLIKSEAFAFNGSAFPFILKMVSLKARDYP